MIPSDLPDLAAPAEQTDISILFARDPLKHTEQDIDRIIAKMREARHTFNSAPTRGAAAPKAAAKPSPLAGMKLDLDLGGL